MSTPYRNIARVLKAHGSKGKVVVAALRGLPFCLSEGMSVALTPPDLKRDRFVTVESVGTVEDGAALVGFSCCRNLDDAEGIAGCLVLARRSDVDLGELDVAFDELIGRTVEDERLGALGCIREVMETPANDVWVIEGERFGEVLVPVVPAVVRELPEDGPISVCVPDGLVG